MIRRIVDDHVPVGLAILLANGHLHDSVMGIRERIWAVLDPQRFVVARVF